MTEFLHSVSFLPDSLIDHHIYIGILVLTTASLVAGYIDAVAGGAGLILIPAFLLTGLPPQLSLGQEKLVSTIGTVAAIKNFLKNQSIIWKIVPPGLVSALVGAYVGARVILFLPEKTLSLIIVAMLPVGLIAAVIKSRLKTDEHTQLRTAFIIVSTVCFVVGFYDGFFGPGTGSLFIIALTLINRFSFLQASATSKMFNFGSNIGAFVAFAMAGQMAYIIGIPMVIASLVGNHVGSLYAIRSNGAIVKKVLFVSVGLMMVTLLLKYFNVY